MDDLVGGPDGAYRLALHGAGRTAIHAGAAGGYRFLLPLHGELLMLQDGREARLGPG
ncbi:hypothetical protein HUX53_33980, partial [Actinomadura sp. BRA 177]|nr:hypothetical protein [Actinomadura sp. BRA 177]